MSKSSVKVESFKGRLRLRWSYKGERYSLSLNLSDSVLARSAAERKATTIQDDIDTGNFDTTKRKYEVGSAQRLPENSLSASHLFGRYTASRLKGLSTPAKQKYNAVGRKINKFFEERSANIDAAAAEHFADALSVTAATQQEYVGMVASCWDWGIQRGLVQCNPWKDVQKRIKVPPKQKARPFDKAEISAILAGFKDSRYYKHYVDFVSFLFGTGCRTGEAIGLRWSHLSHDCGKVWIGESLSGGVRKATKTNKAREFRLSESLKAMLLARRPAGFSPDGLVFPAPKGGAICGRGFRNRAWSKTLEKAKVKYRKPYNTRHTFVSHCLAQGLKPMAISQITGHDPEVLFKYYAADISDDLTTPEIF
jgi:integrase